MILLRLPSARIGAFIVSSRFGRPGRWLSYNIYGQKYQL
nr:MAG TPA_asm: hypothetical protein [Caudoviricetes sp.]